MSGGEQLELVPGRTPEQILAEAELYGPFVRRYCLVSGGRDSSVLAHRLQGAYDELAFVDTGTALPGVLEHVAELAAWLDQPLTIMRTPRDEYDRLVLGSDRPRANGEPDVGAGFPGPALHGTCYTRLKERQLELLLKRAKVGQPRSARVLMLTGIRRGESQRRRSRAAVTHKRGRIFANPLIDWPTPRVYDYAAEHEIPEGDVAALLHRSGECNCGAFAAPGERELLRGLYPAWWADRIAPLEQRAAELGLPATWGAGDAGRSSDEPAGELCDDCQLRLDEAAA